MPHYYPEQGKERRLSADRLNRPLTDSPGKGTDPAFLERQGEAHEGETLRRELFGDFNFQKGSEGPLQSVPTS